MSWVLFYLSRGVQSSFLVTVVIADVVFYWHVVPRLRKRLVWLLELADA